MEKEFVKMEKKFVIMEKEFVIMEKEYVIMEKEYVIMEKEYVIMEKGRSLHMFRNKLDMLTWVNFFSVLPECLKISENNDTVNYIATFLMQNQTPVHILF